MDKISLLNVFPPVAQTRKRTQELKSASQIVQTACGPIETAISGEGPAVLVVHGALGGYDRANVYTVPGARYKFICPSRPGYLRTPLEVGRTADEQADALAALLDALGIEKAALIACSAGGPPSVEFALRYPDRCWALVMGNTVIEPLSFWHGLMHPVAKALFNWDWLTWFGPNRAVLYALQPRLGWQVFGNEQKQAHVKAMLRSIYPTSLRRVGFLNDLEQFQHIPSYALQEVKVPALVVHGTADRVVPYQQGLLCASLIPGAQFLSVPNGTHLCFISHSELVMPALKRFLESHQPAEGTS